MQLCFASSWKTCIVCLGSGSIRYLLLEIEMDPKWRAGRSSTHFLFSITTFVKMFTNLVIDFNFVPHFYLSLNIQTSSSHHFRLTAGFDSLKNLVKSFIQENIVFTYQLQTWVCLLKCHRIDFIY